MEVLQIPSLEKLDKIIIFFLKKIKEGAPRRHAPLLPQDPGEEAGRPRLQGGVALPVLRAHEGLWGVQILRILHVPHARNGSLFFSKNDLRELGNLIVLSIDSPRSGGQP